MAEMQFDAALTSLRQDIDRTDPRPHQDTSQYNAASKRGFKIFTSTGLTRSIAFRPIGPKQATGRP
jgi:hypothetical protein